MFLRATPFRNPCRSVAALPAFQTPLHRICGEPAHTGQGVGDPGTKVVPCAGKSPRRSRSCHATPADVPATIAGQAGLAQGAVLQGQVRPTACTRSPTGTTRITLSGMLSLLEFANQMHSDSANLDSVGV
ncbi:hypothetical protein PBRA_000524 [Plasmodiophora brassicae]|uniref:Uncharacterized protein n=1 Tax=Plasmodiophora brassicae TaxID=37360 RepID=A0A0G4IPW3_PLABS|nr:hypothetical protein PBRA_000524 [Plasmodiophora brassicae]